MRRIFQEERRIVESRFLWANILFLMITALLMIRLWWVQIYKGDYYKQIAENNRIQYLEIPAPRGIIYDRSGEVVLGNRPYFDLVYIPQFVRDRETTFKILGRLLHMPVGVFERRLWMSRGQPKYLPVNLKRNLTLHEVATIQSNKIFLPGIDIAVAPRRDYKPDNSTNLTGYLGEISKTELEKHKKGDPAAPAAEDADYPYRAGDLVGKAGLEWRWEKYLRGNRGHRLIQVDAFGRQVDPSAEGPLAAEAPVAATPGSDLILTIDMELQRVAKEAFRGKNGAVVVLNPQNGEVLAMVSEPGYDPNIYQGGMTEEKYHSLIANPFKPLLDKTTGGVYVPGSTYKAVVAIAGLEEGVINASTTFFCPGHYTLGDKTYKCMHAHGTMNLHNALMKSCDVFFYNVGVALGVDRIAKYAQLLGLGQRTGFLLNFEQPGLVPTSAWKKLTFRVPWSAGETPNIAIGQGQDGLTPLQLANLYATIGNGGYVWRPYVVKRVINPVGETLLAQEPELIRKLDQIKPGTWKLVKEGLEAVVMQKEGTGKAARAPGHTVAGKTGSAQVVSLSKNSGKTQRDVSIAWREHALFAAFSPVDKPEIAVAIVSEHDKQSGGGRSAAPVAGKIIRAFWALKEQRAVAMGLGGPKKAKTATP